MIWIFVVIIVVVLLIAMSRKRDPSDEYPEMNDMNHVTFDKKRINGAGLIKLEQFGEKYYVEAIDAEKKRIQEYIDQLSGKEKMFFPKERTEESLRLHQDELKTIEEMRRKYIRLKERYKHHSIPEQLFVYQDWADYMWSIHRINSNMKVLNVILDNDSADKIFNENNEIYLQMKEIEKRFDDSLK
jgi:hypothetical protein